MGVEIWKAVIGYEGRYEVSNLGRVKSLGRPCNHPRIKFIKEKILKLTVMPAGYITCGIYLNGKPKIHLVHRLVASSFLRQDSNRIFVNHKNGIKSDNRIENLEWVTQQENLNHAFLLGLSCRKGIKNSQSKLDAQKVKYIRECCDRGETFVSIAAHLKVSANTVRCVAIGKTWAHI